MHLIELFWIMRLHTFITKDCTLEYLINVQEVINMQAGKISKIDKRAGGNKAVQVGIFQKSIVKNHKIWKNFKNK